MFCYNRNTKQDSQHHASGPALESHFGDPRLSLIPGVTLLGLLSAVTLQGISQTMATLLPRAAPAHAYKVQLGIRVTGVPPFKFKLLDDATLPAGLLVSSDGVLSGRARTAGDYTFTIVVTDLQGNQTQGSFTLIVSPETEVVFASSQADLKQKPLVEQPRDPTPVVPTHVTPPASSPSGNQPRPAAVGAKPTAAEQPPGGPSTNQPKPTVAGTKPVAPDAPNPVIALSRPTLDSNLGKGVTLLTGQASPSLMMEGHSDKYDKEVRVSLKTCTLPPGQRMPANKDLCTGSSFVRPVSLINGPDNQDHYVVTDKDGYYTVNMKEPIACLRYPKTREVPGGSDQYTYFAVQAVDVASGLKSPYSEWKEACGAVDHSRRCDREYNDCDEHFSVVGGVEQAGLSALPSQTSAFLRAFTRSTPSAQNLSVWANIRLLGAPEASSTANVISAVADPSGVLVTKNFATVGTAIDYIVGGEFAPSRLQNYALGGQYSVSFIAGLGATTPLSSQNLVLAYQVPALATNECAQLQLRFTLNNGYNPSPTPGTVSPAGTTSPNATCLFNTTGVVGTTPNSGVPVKTLAFTNQDRSNFLLKYGVGIRTVTRFHSGVSTVCGDPVPYQPQRGPCSRGVVDFTIGQDQAITGGYLRNFVFKIDGVQPIPIAGSKIFYIFGNASIRLHRNTYFPPLILQPASLDPITKSGPDPSIFILPLKQPDRDFYRYGVGLDLSAIFTKITNKASEDPKPTNIASPKKVVGTPDAPTPPSPPDADTAGSPSSTL